MFKFGFGLFILSFILVTLIVISPDLAFVIIAVGTLIATIALFNFIFSEKFILRSLQAREIDALGFQHSLKKLWKNSPKLRSLIHRSPRVYFSEYSSDPILTLRSFMGTGSVIFSYTHFLQLDEHELLRTLEKAFLLTRSSGTTIRTFDRALALMLAPAIPEPIRLTMHSTSDVTIAETSPTRLVLGLVFLPWYLLFTNAATPKNS